MADLVSASIRVEVVYATAQRQELRVVELPAGASVAQAIEASGILECIPGYAIDLTQIGVFSRRVSLESALADGDRVEIYRPLTLDPKEARRRRAQNP